MSKKYHKYYRIKLSSEEREELIKIRNKRAGTSKITRRAIALLMADERHEEMGKTDVEIAQATGFSTRTIERLREKCCEVGPFQALYPNPRKPSKPKKITGEVVAHTVKIACSEAPEGRSRWTLQLIADRLVELEVIDSISHQSVHNILKKTN